MIDIVLKLALHENTLPAGSIVPVVSFLHWTLTFSSPEYPWLTCYASYLLSHAKSDDMKSLPPYSGDKKRLVKLIKLQFNLSIRPPWGQKTETVVERWPFSRGLNKSQCLNCPLRKSGRCGEVAVQQIRRPVRDQSNHQMRNATLFTDRKTQTEIFNRTKELYHLRHNDLSGIFSIMESTP